ncbi:hypothetical protein [Kitasatospora sp. NPDC086791]|uniref:hypothetical protein n=1 Tax=Kitasatospora sp. NPDC086791 TaxID=3155178 RepID=UPI003437BB2D
MSLLVIPPISARIRARQEAAEEAELAPETPSDPPLLLLPDVGPEPVPVPRASTKGAAHAA